MKRLLIFLALLIPAWATAQVTPLPINCAPNTACGASGPFNTTTGDNLPLAGYKINQNFTAAANQINVDTNAISALNAVVTQIPAGDIWCNNGGSLAFPAACGSLPTGFIVGKTNGGTGTSTPNLVAGTGISISGTWPNQTVTSTVSGGATSINTANGFAGTVSGGGATVSTTITGVPVGNGSSFVSAGCTSSQVIAGTGGCVTAATTPVAVNALANVLYITPSGDTSGATDLATLNTAIASLAANVRTPTGFSQAAPINTILWGYNTFYYTTGCNNILAASTTKTQGIWFQGSGRGNTVIYYNPSTAACPLLVNNRGIDVKFTDFTAVGGTTACPDFLWSQEQAGITNVQDYTFQDVEWQGCWNNAERMTGGNNNSEQKFSRVTASGTMHNFLYVPPQITTTITSGSASIAATNTAEQVDVGDTGFFTGACAPLSANTQYYVVAATTSAFQVATSFGGSPTSFTANCTPSFQTGNDQFLNFWIDSMKFDTGTTQSQLINFAYGGSIKITKFDASNYAPASSGSCLINLGTSVNNGVHSGGVENFSIEGRIELSSNNACVMTSNWWRGQIKFDNWDESSQAGNRTITNVYHTYNFTQNGGPTVEYRNSQLMGKHAYVVGSNDYTYQSAVHYENVTLMDNPTFANFIAMSGTNTGGYPIIECDHCKNNVVSSTAGYQEIVDTSLNWQYAAGKGAVHTRTVSCLGAQSNWPTSSGNIQFRLPLNAAITQFRWWKVAGSSNTGAYSYTAQSTEATPTVIGGPFTGTASGSAIALQTTYGANGSTLATTTPFVMTTDLARTIEIIDNTGRAGAFGSGLYCLIDYIG